MSRRRGLVLVALLFACLMHTPNAATQRSGQLQPDVSGDTDGRHAWMTAVYRDLIVRKLSNRLTGAFSIDLRHDLDVVTIAGEGSGRIRVSRGARKVAVNSHAALAEVSHLLQESDGVAQLLALERRSVRLHSAPEIALLTTIAFVGSLAGDEEAVNRLRGRAFDDPLWFQPVPPDRCALEYVIRSSEAWEGACASSEIPGDERLACWSNWFQEVERAWFEYLNCVSPVVRPSQRR